MTAERDCAAALDRTHDLDLVEADVAGIGAPPRRPVIAEDIYRLLSQSFFSEYSCLSKDSELVRMDRAQRRARGRQGVAWKRWSKLHRQSAGLPLQPLDTTVKDFHPGKPQWVR
jgi:hypothetical protein